MKQIILALMLAVAGIGAAVAANPIREGNMISGHVLVKGSEENIGEFYQFNLSSCIRQQNSLTAQFVSFSLSNLANIFYPPPIFTIINLCLL